MCPIKFYSRNEKSLFLNVFQVWSALTVLEVYQWFAFWCILNVFMFMKHLFIADLNKMYLIKNSLLQPENISMVIHCPLDHVFYCLLVFFSVLHSRRSQHTEKTDHHGQTGLQDKPPWTSQKKILGSLLFILDTASYHLYDYLHTHLQLQTNLNSKEQ